MRNTFLKKKKNTRGYIFIKRTPCLPASVLLCKTLELAI